jgi:hypothetical protein
MATPIDSAGQANSFADAFQLGAGAVRVWLEIMVTNTTGMMHGLFSLLKHAAARIGLPRSFRQCGMRPK